MAFFKANSRRPRSIAEGVVQRTVDKAFIPPLSTRVVLTDRADGTLWLLSFSTTPAGPDGLGYISILTPPPDRPDQGNYTVYGPSSGPVVSWVSTPVAHSQGVDPRPEVFARLLVRGGYLGFEAIPDRIYGRRVVPRKRVERGVREIIRPSTYTPSGPFNVLAWRDMEF